MSNRSETAKLLNVIQILSEIAVAAGYFIALIPFVYLFSWQWVVPLTAINVILGWITGNRTAVLSAVNFAMSLLSFIPLVGYLFRLIGLVISAINIVIIRRYKED